MSKRIADMTPEEKEARGAHRRKYYAANPEKFRGAARKWRAANTEKVREVNRRNRHAKKFGPLAAIIKINQGVEKLTQPSTV